MKKLVFLTILCMFISTHLVRTDTEVCPPTQDVCEYHFTVQEMLTMHLYPFGRLGATNGSLHLLKEDPTNITTKIPVDRVIMADGVVRMVTVINNRLPGPPIIVHEGQEVVVHVQNSLGTQSTTLHWHGLHMMGTPWMDGATMVTQCPISPGQAFTYKFKASPVGTHYYHAHVTGQRMDGMSGALVVRPRPPEQQANTVEVGEAIMQVSDWWHESSEKVSLRLKNMDYFTEPGWTPTILPNGVFLHPIDYYSVLIEGRGRFTDKTTGETIETPLHVYNIEQFAQLRVRAIAAGNVLPFRVSVDNHALVVVATDGNEIEPRPFESVILNPGERFDFIITANQSVGNYWIRVETLHTGNLHAKAVLRYNGAPTADPATTRTSCTPTTPCHVINCMFKQFPNKPNTKCVSLDEVRGSDEEVIPFEEDSEEFFLNFAAEFTPQYGYNMFMNGKRHDTQYSDMFYSNNNNNDDDNEKVFTETKSCGRKECVDNPGRVCRCFNVQELPSDKTVQVVITSVGTDAEPYNHPIHLHGHNFQLLKIGHSTQDDTTGKKTGVNEDIACTDRSCHTTRWKNAIRGNNVSGLNRNPIRKDTVNIPAGGYAVVRFRTNNPGKWLMHCHIDFDQKDGMALVLNVASEQQPLPPTGMPVCQHFVNDGKHLTIEDEDESDEEVECGVWCILFFVLLALVLLQNLIFCACVLYRRKKGEGKGRNDDTSLDPVS